MRVLGSFARGLIVLVCSLALVWAIHLASTGENCRHTNASPWGCDVRAALVGLVGMALLAAITTWVLRGAGVGWAVLGTAVSLAVSVRATALALAAWVGPISSGVVELAIYAVVFTGFVVGWDLVTRRPRGRRAGDTRSGLGRPATRAGLRDERH